VPASLARPWLRGAVIEGEKAALLAKNVLKEKGKN
jgi:hypothetical protein